MKDLQSFCSSEKSLIGALITTLFIPTEHLLGTVKGEVSNVELEHKVKLMAIALEVAPTEACYVQKVQKESGYRKEARGHTIPLSSSSLRGQN